MTTNKQIHDAVQAMALGIILSRDEWLSYWMRQILPPVCVRWTDERKNLGAIARYCERKQIRTVCDQSNSRTMLMRGDSLIATFEVKTTRR